MSRNMFKVAETLKVFISMGSSVRASDGVGVESSAVIKSDSQDSGLREARVESWVLALDLNNSKFG
jgi:hypothetical protein